MKFAVSNIALPSFNHQKYMLLLSEIGFQGLEVAPSKVWQDTSIVTFSQVQAYARKVEKAGLRTLGLHSLFFDQPELGLFKGNEIRKKTLQFLIHLSKVCADLGGKTLVYGSPGARKRNGLLVTRADAETIDFFNELSVKIESHGTVLLIEALSRNETDYINSVLHALTITQQVNRPQLQSHMDAKALVDAGEVRPEVFSQIVPTLLHYHANEPGLGILSETGQVNHAELGGLLKRFNYRGYVSLEQKMVDQKDPILPIMISYSVLKKCYS